MLYKEIILLVTEINAKPKQTVGTEFIILRCFRKIVTSDYQHRHVSLSAVLMEKLRAHWTQFDQTLYLNIVRKTCLENSSFIEI